MPELNKVHNVLFDLDGTLVDSSKTILDSVFHALGTLGVDPQSGPDVRSLIGMPLFDIFVGQYGMAEDRAQLAIDHYREYYEQLNQAGTTVFAGVRDGLAALQESGLQLFIATVKPTSIAEKVLSDLRLREHFAGVAGASMGPERRDKTSIIAHALSTFGLMADRTVMVGDRDQDILGARANGLPSMAVTYGFGHRDELAAARPDHSADHFRDVSRILVNGG
jgi:phosphoglycolate phosphatase